ncbi:MULTISPECIES: M56 family metallopeptidase [unclassified Streptomyces]|uniref:M56 family metallopeptidase n=1 Tax=unclassified Streptomyces TaxID=2593676 RepID=UPI0019067D75|nr:M56 family metallopeptidase [Streptomyces sp. HSG2]
MAFCLLLLSVVALTTAVPAARALSRAEWTERDPIVGLWAWQCLVAGALLCIPAALALGGSAVFDTVHARLFAPAPPEVAAAYALSPGPAGAAALVLLPACGAGWTVAVLVRELLAARRRHARSRARLRERAPELPAGLAGGADPLLVVEDAYPDTWRVPGRSPRLVVTTGALRRLSDGQLDAVLTHERDHARARHDWLLHLSTALADGFPRVPLFAHFRDQTHRLVELAADDAASRRCGHRTTALALIELNQHRGVLSCASSHRLLGERVGRLLDPRPRPRRRRRALATAAASLVPLLPLVITFVPGLTALP